MGVSFQVTYRTRCSSLLKVLDRTAPSPEAPRGVSVDCEEQVKVRILQDGGAGECLLDGLECLLHLLGPTHPVQLALPSEV